MKLLTRLFLRSCPGLLVAAMSATPALATQDPSASLLETLEDPDATLADVTALLDAGANPNALGSQGWTPLQYAAAFGENPAIIVALLQAGADPNAREGRRRDSPALGNEVQRESSYRRSVA